MKPLFGPSAEDFLDALRAEGQLHDLLNHILDEVNALADDHYIDMMNKLPYPVPAQGPIYRILWGTTILGRSFWYIYEADEDSNLVLIYNIGHAGLEQPFLSRR